MRRQERIGREASAQGARPAQIFLEGTGKRLAVRGHRGILEYTAEVLRLRLPGDEGEARIEGENLVLERMDGEDAVVTGRVHRVTLEEGQGERGVRGGASVEGTALRPFPLPTPTAAAKLRPGTHIEGLVRPGPRRVSGEAGPTARGTRTAAAQRADAAGA